MVLEKSGEAADAKRIKTEEVKNVLTEFEFVKVLNENSLSKLMIIQAAKKNAPGDKKDAVIIFEKPHFGVEEVNSFLKIDNEFEVDLLNDIYTKLCIFPVRPFNSNLDS